ncbi:hypothetical protein [Nitratireductor aquibiodomus]|uniref:hypothetical protein n=1 Tax=Nitratireductor aquibiodomus TaxID=204799 RepID=UPI0012DDF76F|nr:hypothetical protein [Nitratireductor aquibiodomus]
MDRLAHKPPGSGGRPVQTVPVPGAVHCTMATMPISRPLHPLKSVVHAVEGMPYSIVAVGGSGESHENH